MKRERFDKAEAKIPDPEGKAVFVFWGDPERDEDAWVRMRDWRLTHLDANLSEGWHEHHYSMAVVPMPRNGEPDTWPEHWRAFQEKMERIHGYIHGFTGPHPIPIP